MSKQIKITTIVGALVLGLGAVLFIAQPKATEQNTNTSHANMSAESGEAMPGILEANETFHDFGTISMKNGKVSKIFKVRNVKTESVTLTKIYTSCMCTDAKLTVAGKTQGPFGMLGHGIVPKINENLAPSQEAEVEVVFNPNAHGPAGVGTIERSVTIEGQNGKLTQLNIKANVIP